MGISHVLYIIAQHLRHLAVTVVSIIVIFNPLLPGGKMYLIDTHRLPVTLLSGLLCLLFLVFLILPFIAVQRGDTGSISRPELCIIAIRIGLVQLLAVPRRDLIFVSSPFPCPRHKKFVDTTLPVQHHFVQTSVPHIKITNDTDAARSGRPYDKTGTRHSIHGLDMRTKFFINLIMLSLAKYIAVKIRQRFIKRIGILYLNGIILSVSDTEGIFFQTFRFLFDHIAKQSLNRHFLHLSNFFTLFVQQPDLFRTGTVCCEDLDVLFFKNMAAQQILRSIDHSLFQLCHQFLSCPIQ